MKTPAWPIMETFAGVVSGQAWPASVVSSHGCSSLYQAPNLLPFLLGLPPCQVLKWPHFSFHFCCASHYPQYPFCQHWAFSVVPLVHSKAEERVCFNREDSFDAEPGFYLPERNLSCLTYLGLLNKGFWDIQSSLQREKKKVPIQC